VDEPRDVVAALDALDPLADPSGDADRFLVGWSFGADVALSVNDPRVAGWVAIAPPLRFGQPAAAGEDERPKLLVLAQHDEVRAPQEVHATVGTWRSTQVEVVAGASHFFIGRTDRVVAATLAFVREHAAR
jgi:alpha/beta superfamily hydrolase